jgi:hypothetical protein
MPLLPVFVTSSTCSTEVIKMVKAFIVWLMTSCGTRRSYQLFSRNSLPQSSGPSYLAEDQDIPGFTASKNTSELL